jgi:hypothetical protein
MHDTDAPDDYLESASYSQGAFFHTPAGYILFLPEEYNEETTWHEALHATTKMWGDAGAQLDVLENDEVLTYTQEHIVRLIKEALYATPDIS